MTLSAAQLERIAILATSFADLIPMSSDAWVESISCEADSEEALQAWERRLQVFKKHAPAIATQRRKMEVLQACLLYSQVLPGEVRECQFETLTQAEIQEICRDLDAR